MLFRPFASADGDGGARPSTVAELTSLPFFADAVSNFNKNVLAAPLVRYLPPALHEPVEYQTDPSWTFPVSGCLRSHGWKRMPRNFCAWCANSGGCERLPPASPHAGLPHCGPRASAA